MHTIIQIAAKLYQCQEAAKKLYLSEYKERIQWYKDVINNHAEKHKIEPLKAVIDLCSNQEIKSNGMAVMMFMAAAVEIIEPSKN